MIGTEDTCDAATISEWGPHLITQAATIELMTIAVSRNDSFTYFLVNLDQSFSSLPSLLWGETVPLAGYLP